MDYSRTKRWIIGLLLLAAVVAVAAGYMLSGKASESGNKGTLVRMFRDGGHAAAEALKDGEEFLCEKIEKVAKSL